MGDSSTNRIQTYQDEQDVVRYAVAQLGVAGLSDRATMLEGLSRVIGMTETADSELYHGNGIVELEADEELVGADQETESVGLQAAIDELVDAFKDE